MDRSLVKTRENAPLNQVLTVKGSGMQRAFHTMQNALQKSCIMVSRFMCIPLDPSMCGGAMCCSAQRQQPKKDNIEHEALQGLRSTVLIVNISNSTLNDCVIGDNAYKSTVTEQQPLMRQPEQFAHGRQTCSCSHEQQGAERVPSFCPSVTPPSDAEQRSINIKDSRFNYVIIGDNSYMHAEQDQPFE